jgi:osmotically-inducible protein OsmY
MIGRQNRAGIPSERSRRNPYVTLLTVLAVLTLAACAPKQDRRSFGTVIDDQTAEAKIIDVLYSREEFDDEDHIKVETHNATLLLAGETKSESNKALASELAQQLKSVDRVVNELAVMPAADTGGRFNNSYITTKVNSKLTTANPIEGFDATRIKVITARRHVYLMGTVTREEAEAVSEVVRNVKGVEKVIRVFDYSD